MAGNMPCCAGQVPWAGAQLALVAGEGGGEAAAAEAAAAGGHGAAFYSMHLQLPANYAGPVTVALSPVCLASTSNIMGSPISCPMTIASSQH